MLSVVIANGAGAGGSNLPACLAALEPQIGAGIETVVVSAGASPAGGARYPWIAWVDAPLDALVPELWGRGIAGAQGALVALTTSQFTPAADWIDAILGAHARLKSAATGGPVDPPQGGRVADWATYFLRYSAYLPGQPERAVRDLAGDNAAYTQDALRALDGRMEDGFWEQELHRRLLADGKTLAFVPAMRVRHVGPVEVGTFLRQRFAHGVRYGRTRVRQHGAAWRALAIAGSPLIPVVSFTKIAVRVLRRGQDLGAFARSLPFLAVFLAAWAAGEAMGYAVPGARPDVPKRSGHGGH